MRRLVLKSGGSLAYANWVCNDETDDGEYVFSDVTEQAVAYLMEPVSFEGEVYLRDVFTLLEACPALLDAFARVHARAYLTEAKKGGAPYTGEYGPEEIEYLELTPDWEGDPETRELSGGHRLSLAGVGHVLREWHQLNGGAEYAAGTRIRWSVMYCPLAQLLNVPLRFDGRLALSVRTGEDPWAILVAAPMLGQVIQAVLWEVSFGGGPEETAAFVEALDRASTDTESWRTIAVEELNELYQSKSGDE